MFKKLFIYPILIAWAVVMYNIAGHSDYAWLVSFILLAIWTCYREFVLILAKDFISGLLNDRLRVQEEINKAESDLKDLSDYINGLTQKKSKRNDK